ncbi:MAG: hypothetical protein ACI9EX_000581 [Oleispira sp.]|jgi:hypothetical protein
MFELLFWIVFESYKIGLFANKAFRARKIFWQILPLSARRITLVFAAFVFVVDIFAVWALILRHD